MKRLGQEKAVNMVQSVTDDEFRCAMFGIANQARGPDWYTSLFFKKTWDIVGGDVSKAVKDLFSNGKLLQEINHTIIALLPKVTTPSRVDDYRPISCCNVIYKCISKINTIRIKDGLDDIVSDNLLLCRGDLFQIIFYLLKSLCIIIT